jgi:phosphate uptake regulator
MVVEMELRKLQKTGGSSYIVSLPKEWVLANNLHEQDKVGIMIREDGNLIIIPAVDRELASKEKEIKVDDIPISDKGKDFLYRLLVGAYITGYNIIRVTICNANRLDPMVTMISRKFKQDVIGLEIIEERHESIVMKDLLNPQEMRFNVLVDRISSLVETQLEDALLAIEQRDSGISDKVISTDADVNRIHWLILRQYSILLSNVTISEKLDKTEKKDANFSLISRSIERIGDHAVRIASNNLELVKTDLSPEGIELVIKAGRSAIKIFKGTISAFVNDDMYSANEFIDKVVEHTNLCELVEQHALTLETKAGIALGNIAESIRRAAEYSADIAEYAINYLTDKSKF